MKQIIIISLILILAAFINHAGATKLVKIKIIDKDYLLIHFMDGQVNFLDDGKGTTAFTSDHDTGNNSVQRFGTALNTTIAVLPENWTIKSADDFNYAAGGLKPLACYRKTKLNGMAEMDWNTSLNDYNYDFTLEHSIYLKLPQSMVQGKSYTIEVNANTNSDVLTQTIEFDIFNKRSEAIHVNLVGYIDDNSVKAADLFLWMGNGGARDYSKFVGNKVFVYDVLKGESTEAGTVAFWKSSATEAGGYNLTASNVWKCDFTGFKTPGTYRIVVEGVGCSEDFEIRKNIYFEPFRVSTLGFFYMRIGQDNLKMVPVPRRPLYIPGQSPSNTKVYITSMHPFHASWGTFSSGDVWDRPNDWAAYVKPGNPQNQKAFGGHSDALDWDRHLGHISIIYDMLLPYFLTNGKISDDNLGLAESGNGIPDILDEARNEVDFWLRLRNGLGYSHGLTNPNSSNILYQADNTALAAWASSANCAMLANCFQIAGLTDLMNIYKDSAIVAFNYASALADPMLDKKQDVGESGLRGRDLKMMAAAYLYNITGNTVYEDELKSLSVALNNTSNIADGNLNQLWASAAYLKTKQTVHYSDLFNRMKASIINEAKNKEANYINTRPSRRATDNVTGYFKTIQNVQRTIVAHAITDNAAERDFFANALVLEADWGLGRNSLNIIYMTTATTQLSGKKSIENAYTSGRDDGTPGLHPGHTPYINTDDWAAGMIMGRPSWMTSKCFPDYSSWPKAEGYFNTRYVWSHAEFTPQQTMRGKTALYGYLYGFNKPANVVYSPFKSDAGKTNKLEVYPNPARGYFSVKLTGNKAISDLKVFNLQGKIIFNETVNSSFTQVVTTGFKPGLYLIKVISEDCTSVEKLFISG